MTSPTPPAASAEPTPFAGEPAPAVVHLRAAGVSVLIDARGGRLPAVAHWGADLGPLSAADAAALADAAVPPAPSNAPDAPMRVAIVPEAHTGWNGRPGLAGSRDGRDWTPLFRLGAVSVRADGADAAGTTAAAGTTVGGVDGNTAATAAVPGATAAPEADAAHEGTAAPEADAAVEAHAGPAASAPFAELTGGGAAVFDAADPTARLGLRLEVELAASGLLRARATLTNDGEPYQLDELSLALPIPARAAELLDFAGHWGKERVPQRGPLRIGAHLREGRRGRTGADAATMLSAGVPGFGFASGEVWGVHVGFSGNHRHWAERQPTGEQVLGGGELLLPGEVVLGAGGSYTTPWLYAAYGDGLDAQARRVHRFLRARPQHPRTPRPMTLNVWEAVYFDHDLARLRDLADRAAALGVERFVLDDGWFRHRRNDRAGLGDWYVDETVWPAGLAPLVEHVRGLGMQFGLWFEPEMVSPDSDLARAHPEWMLQPAGRLPIPSRHQQVLNLGMRPAYDYVLERISAIVAEHGIPYLKWDHNRDLVDAGTAPGGQPGVHEQTLAAYRLIDELKARFPGLEIESCSSGGARVDLGILERTDRVWASDCIDPAERQQINRWTAQLIPLELLGSHIASGRSHTTHRVHDLSFRAGTALFGHYGIEWDLAKASPAELAELKGWVALYVAQRGLLHSGDLVRGDTRDGQPQVTGVVAADRSRALFALAFLDTSAVTPTGRFTLPGLDAGTRYRVRPLALGRPERGRMIPGWFGAKGADAWAGTVLPGAALAHAGLQAPNSYPDQVWLFEVRAEGDARDDSIRAGAAGAGAGAGAGGAGSAEAGDDEAAGAGADRRAGAAGDAAGAGAASSTAHPTDRAGAPGTAPDASGSAAASAPETEPKRRRRGWRRRRS